MRCFIVCREVGFVQKQQDVGCSYYKSSASTLSAGCQIVAASAEHLVAATAEHLVAATILCTVKPLSCVWIEEK